VAITTVTYTNSKAYVGKTRQPMADIALLGPARRFPVLGVLVDTGADLLQVPANAAASAGFPLGAGTKIPIGTAGGKATMILLSGVVVEIEGIRVTTDLLCHPNPGSRPLLGRAALAALVAYGFDAVNWVWV